MPSTATTLPEELTARLSSEEDGESLLRVLREVKNQIIGNKTKKLIYLQLGAVPRVVSILASASERGDSAAIVQAAAAVGSFACGVDDGVRAVLDAGALVHLFYNLSHSDDKVVDACARSLRMIFQSKVASKYDLLHEKHLKLLLSLLGSGNENVTELASSIVTHSCETTTEQKALCDAGILEKLAYLFEGSLNQRDASLEAIFVIVRKNTQVATYFACIDDGRALNSLIELVKDRHPRTRLLACTCLISIGEAPACYVLGMQIKTKIMMVLIELLRESGRFGDDAPFSLLNLILDKEELQKQGFSLGIVVTLCDFLHKTSLHPRRLEGIILVLAELCSRLEECRSQIMSLKVLDEIAFALKHESQEVRVAACVCIRNLSRSVKNLTTGALSCQKFVIQLVQLLHDPSIDVKVAALGAICNIVVDFKTRKSLFIQYGGVKQLVHLSKSMDCTLRLNAVWAMRNLMFLADVSYKQSLVQELTVATLDSLICDSETPVQELALALVSSLINGWPDYVKYVFAEDDLIVNSVVRLLHSTSSPEVRVQGMLLLTNIAAGDELHKEAVMSYLIPSKTDGRVLSGVLQFLQSGDESLRTTTVWCLINLIYPHSSSSAARVERLRDAGIISQLKTMINDLFLDTKFRVRTALELCMLDNNSS